VVKRIGIALATALGLFLVTIVAEVFVVMRREFLPTEPAYKIEGTFGPSDGVPLRFVVLGDSTAAGLGASEPRYSYAVRLSEMLAADGFRVEMTGVGFSGATVADVLDEQVDSALELQPDLVFVGIGANDATHLTTLHSFGKDLGEVYDKLGTSGVTIVGSGIPDMRAKAFLEPLRSIVGWRGRELSDVVRREAEKRSIPVVPLAERTAAFFVDDPDAAYASDLFHPGDGGYAAWAEAIYPELIEAVRSTK
jgi:lysophospholipase L1-like esterase